MSDENDSWLKTTLGIDVPSFFGSGTDAGAAVVDPPQQAPSSAASPFANQAVQPKAPAPAAPPQPTEPPVESHAGEFGEAGRELGEVVGHGVGSLLEERMGPAPGRVLGEVGAGVGEVVGTGVGVAVDAAEEVKKAAEAAWDWATERGGSDPLGGTSPPGGVPEDQSPDGGATDTSDGPDGGAPTDGGESKLGTDNDALTAMVKSEIVNQINAQVPGKVGLIDELNDLENFSETNAVPENTTSFEGKSQAELDQLTKEKESAIKELEEQRLVIAKKTRADARLATESLKRDLTATLLAPGSGVVAGLVTSFALASRGGALTLLGALVVGIIVQHNLYAKYRDGLRLSVDKAKTDIRIINTKIAFQRKQIDAIKKTTPSQVTKQPSAPVNVRDLPNAP